MSTHIEHGTRVRVKTLAEFNALILDYQRQVEAVARAVYDQQCVRLVYAILDQGVLQPTYEAFLDAIRQEYATVPFTSPPLADTDLRWIVRHIIADHQANIARTQMRDPVYDWGCYLAAIPHRTGIYVLVYAESEAYHELWRALPGVEDYAYWNHTDPPDDISSGRWARRRQRWDELMPDGIPSHAGMTIDIYDPLIDGGLRFWEVSPACIPDFAARVQHWAFEQAMAEQWAQEPPEDRGFQTMFRTQQWIKTPEGAEHFDALQQSLRAILPSLWDTKRVHQTPTQLWASLEPLRRAYQG